ncbi:IclR family transcriptional regulator [Tianweitania sediminis]|uniref:Helix-turn-helix domain-containing protein n=1 Tax=Tianweitania sediminis TaxID=1502156 RepID=A0A8J7RJV5_9HYPH|nr:IclR family transcriptional regulator C-terminal domain-containing protein [Tianweitania sediminis]MBP0437049.1 helix-turn-helix domain-containing protein [Tianweitania sediminis]HEV7417311.1 IclR family transcriptional regulator C-terminal domain-containing protein [Tianweitania sediminis]
MQRAKGTDRILDILDHLENVTEPISRNALAKALDCPRSTIYSLVDQLVARDWLAVADDGGIRLGHRAGLLGLAYSRSAQFERMAREVVQRVAVETGVVTEINVADNWQQLVLISATGRSRNYLQTVEGSRYPLPITGSARLQLAGIPRDSLARNIHEEEFRLGSGKLLPFDRFCEEIEQAGRDGYFVARGLIEPYVGTLGTPILNRLHQCVATLSIVLPQADLDSRQQDLIDTLRRGSDELSSSLRTAVWPMGDRAHSHLHRDRNAL